jgi:hypothetical protein
MGCRGSSRPAEDFALAGRSRRNRGEDQTERYWLYAATDVETKLLLDVMLSLRRDTDPATESSARQLTLVEEV